MMPNLECTKLRQLAVVAFMLATPTTFVCLSPVGFGQQSTKISSFPKPDGGENTLVKPQDGITREQAEAMFAELHEIRRLLEQQQAELHRAFMMPGPPPQTVKINVATDWHAMGSDDAPVTIVEFTDLQCSFCRRFHVETFPKIQKEYIDTGMVRFVSLDLPLEFHQNALKAAEASWCAGDQGKFWEMRNAILESTVPLTEDFMLNLSKTLALDLAAWRTCLDSERYKSAVEREAEEASTLQINGTPTFVVARSAKDRLDGVRIVGIHSFPEFQLRLDELLKGAATKSSNTAHE